jgi:hypothetical protein
LPEIDRIAYFAKILKFSSFQVICNSNGCTHLNQAGYQVRTDETRTAGHEHVLILQDVQFFPVTKASSWSCCHELHIWPRPSRSSAL